LELNPFLEKRTGRPKPLIPEKMILKSWKYSFNGEGHPSMNYRQTAARQRAERRSISVPARLETQVPDEANQTKPEALAGAKLDHEGPPVSVAM
jgi:hypothetical protein